MKKYEKLRYRSDPDLSGSTTKKNLFFLCDFLKIEKCVEECSRHNGRTKTKLNTIPNSKKDQQTVSPLT